jgi:amicyanin
MKTSFILGGILLLAVVIGAGTVAYGHHSATTPSANSTQTQKTAVVVPNSVSIKNYAYSPSPLTVKVGTTVTWTNTDIARHTVTVDDATKNGPKSPFFGQGQSYSFTFTQAGTFTYHCEPHPYMHGTVEVTP